METKARSEGEFQQLCAAGSGASSEEEVGPRSSSPYLVPLRGTVAVVAGGMLSSYFGTYLPRLTPLSGQGRQKRHHLTVGNITQRSISFAKISNTTLFPSGGGLRCPGGTLRTVYTDSFGQVTTLG